MLLLSLLLSSGAFASQASNDTACDKFAKGQSSLNFCYGISDFEDLEASEISLCANTFTSEKVFKRCIDEAATSGIFKNEITACRTSTSLDRSAINCLYAAAHSIYLTEEDIIDCGETTNFPNSYSACLVDRAGDL